MILVISRFNWLAVVFCCLLGGAMVGCGEAEPTVVEAPPTEEDDSAMPGMSDEEYNKEMEKEMGG
ncbi:MAG: hypothetical protein AAF802_27815 [Planctomycetota bacterium]